MLGLNRRYLFISFSVFMMVAAVSAGLSYFLPSPPSTLVIATAFKGASFDYYGQRYREKFAAANVKLELRATEGALENLSLLKDSSSGVEMAFVTGGVSNGEQSPGLLSLGTIDYLPIWIFYSSAEPFDRLSSLKGKRIAVGPIGSGTRYTAEKILGKGGVSYENATFVPVAGSAAAEALRDGKIDAAFILGAPTTPAVQTMFRDRNIRLMNFATAEAFSRIYPNLARLVLPRGVIDIEGDIPSSDVTLIATTSSVLVRNDLHPEIVSLLLQTMLEIHRVPGIFQRAGEFPMPSDPEYPVAANAVDFYKNGPSFLQRHLPLWLTVHAQRAIAVVVAAIALGLPLFHYLPMLYAWNMRRRLLYWYGQLKSLEAAIDANPNSRTFAERQADIDKIEAAVSRIRFPLALTNQLYDLRGHIDIVRRRFSPQASTLDRAAE